MNTLTKGRTLPDAAGVSWLKRSQAAKDEMQPATIVEGAAQSTKKEAPQENPAPQANPINQPHPTPRPEMSQPDMLMCLAEGLHDMRTPLNVVSEVARLLRRGDADPRDMNLWLERIDRNAAYLERVVKDLSASLKSQWEPMRPHWEVVDITALASEIVSDFGIAATDHKLHFEGEDRCFVLGDRAHLRSMLMNLLSNAVKYSAPGREVRVTVWRRGVHAHIAVQDDGVGIAVAERERIFLPFTRLDDAREMAEGSGLGLVSAQRVVEMHGGSIIIQGEPNRGTTVEVCLKICWQHGAPAA